MAVGPSKEMWLPCELLGAVPGDVKMPEIRTIRYDDGRWCEQEYVDGKLHGRWTVFYANGQKEWERQHVQDRHEGYFRKWDQNGRLVEEMWYHLGVLHGNWKQCNEAGKEEVVGDFHYGYSRAAFERTVNPDFNILLKPYYGLEPADFADQVKTLLPALRKPTLRMKKRKRARPDLSQAGSFWSHVNVLGVHEEWPTFQGEPLYPILQINCADVTLADNPLAGFSVVTLFSVAGDILHNLGEDIVVRAYRREDKIVLTEPPCEPLEVPRPLAMGKPILSYPDENDMPPGFRVYLEESGDQEQVLHRDEKLNSRLGGWPGWLQDGRVSEYDKFAFQVDSLDVEGWDCGDCTIHYFFLDRQAHGFSWCQEMC